MVVVVGRRRTWPSRRRSSRRAVAAPRPRASRRRAFLVALRRANVAGRHSTWGSRPGLAPGARLVDARGAGRDALAQLARDGRRRAGARSCSWADVLGNVADAELARAPRWRARDVVVVDRPRRADARARRRRPAGRAWPTSARAPSPTSRAASRALGPEARRARLGLARRRRSPPSSPTSSAQSLGLVVRSSDGRAPSKRRTGYPALSVLTLGRRRGWSVAGRAARAGAAPARPDGLPGHPLDRDRRPRPPTPARSAAPARPRPRGGAPTRASPRPDAPRVEVPHADAYAWRVLRRAACTTTGSRCGARRRSAPLGRPPCCACNHLDLDRLGVADGGEVVAVGPRGSARLAVERCDDVGARRRRGRLRLARAPDGADVVRSWLARGDAVAEVRLETRDELAARRPALRPRGHLGGADHRRRAAWSSPSACCSTRSS